MGSPLRILCLSNMYPGADAPDYGAFIQTMCDALEARGNEVARVVIDSRARGLVQTPAKYLGLARRAAPAAAQADVIYAHYLFPTGAIARFAGRRAGIPWVITAHGGDVRNLSSPSLAALSAPALTGATSLIAVSRYLADQLRATGLRLPTMYVADMGVDLERFQPRNRVRAREQLGVPGQGALIAAIGGLTERKNPLRLLQALTIVRRVRPDSRLVFVGDGPLAGAVRAGIALHGLDDAVTLTGALPNSAVAGWLAAADLLALPSTVEPLGVVALEAMACGRPVVATRVGGTAEVVGRAGTLIDPLDPQSIADGVLRVLSAPPTAAQCRLAAEGHSVARQAAKVEAILASAAHAAGPRHRH